MLFAATIMSSILFVKRRLTVMIKRFKFEELESAVMPIFPEISWSRVKSKLVRNHERFTVINAWRVIEDVLENIDLRVKDLQNRLAMLEVIDISRHKRKLWYGYEATGAKEANLEKRDIQENITDEFRSYDLDMNVKVAMYDNITFIYVKEEKKRKGRPTTPTFFALFLGHKYFFCSKKEVSLDYIKVIATSLGYNNSKKIKLIGRDLKSLMKLLWYKQQGVLCAEYVNQPPIFQPSDPVVSNNGMDYTQSKQRKKYAEQCFGKEPPTLEMLVIKGPKESIQHNDVASKLPSEGSIHMNWEFRSRNIAKFLTALIEKRAFTLPLPDYISDLMVLGKNELTLQID